MVTSSVTSSLTSFIPWNSDLIVFSLLGRLEMSKYHVTVLSPFFVTKLFCVISKKVENVPVKVITYPNLDTGHEQCSLLINIVLQFQIDRKCSLSVRIGWPKIVVVSLKILSTFFVWMVTVMIETADFCRNFILAMYQRPVSRDEDFIMK